MTHIPDEAVEAALLSTLKGEAQHWRDSYEEEHADEIFEDMRAALSAALSIMLEEPGISMYQARDGAWHQFDNEGHKARTIASGEWLVRDFYAIKEPQP
ncbi:hypothetical protein [Pseudoxanthomonas winnipegensis]|uniref:Uncharacterized protein n=1 Tax=Pseudoxanthomonas winnipegensis TaxID=2480810 RepID=A0A4Q8L5D3_9GAMM|nr:hypothetical protein [Pseudoxanthomonas winnipegensis]TAA20337.1 hypothetical protein EA660_18280 [Pseudoxanthomonas winnipegensis]